ncbi:MAG: hypothetical protein RL369_672, partial [Pseudomonadota bacterium]
IRNLSAIFSFSVYTDGRPAFGLAPPCWLEGGVFSGGDCFLLGTGYLAELP